MLDFFSLEETFLRQVAGLVALGFDLLVVVPFRLPLVVFCTFLDLITLFIKRSRFRRRASSLCSALANSILGDFNPILTGATASVPKARANGVS